MLGKLIKHEWKSTYKICGALLLFMVATTVLAGLSFHTPMWRVIFEEKYQTGFVPTPLDFAGLMSLMFYILSMVGVVWGIIIYLGVHFYKSMYSEEGYLTHTLPVTSHQLLAGKLLIAGIWYLLVLLVMILSILSLVFALFGVAFNAQTQGMSLWRFLSENMGQIMSELHRIFDFNVTGQIIMYIAMLVFGSFTSIMSLYGAVTLGQLFAKHRVMMSIVSYFAISMVTQIVTSIVTMPVTIASTRRMIEHPGTVTTMPTVPTSLISLAVSIGLAVVLYFVSNYIITRKLNLE